MKSIIYLVFCLFLFFPTLANAQNKQLDINYTVKLASIENQLFHISTEIKNISQDKLELSLPVWTPGWYTIENYGKNILRFRVTNDKGEVLNYQRMLKQTWVVNTKSTNSIKIDFDYQATVLALNQAKISSDFAFFTGIQLFLQVGKERNTPATVRFDVPDGWNIISALKETSDPKVFTATDYDTLVDSPTQFGKFDLTRFQVAGKPHYFVATPAGTFSKEKTEKYVQMLSKMVLAQKDIFGDLPYEKYIHFYFFQRPESNAGGALEHSNSYVAFAAAGVLATPESLIGTASHEFFHVWNVKKIRPAEMWPYDYSKENETPLLWVSEGFTSYYGPLALYRAGIYDQKTFLGILANLATNIENNEAHKYISPAESSVSTWLGYDTRLAFEISYYTTGANLAALLDLSIRYDTKGKSSLDDVMRTLYQDFYKKNKGFSTNDLIQVINNITKNNYQDFFQKYVFGTEVIPYEKFYKHAGLILEKNITKYPILGVNTSITNTGEIQITDVIANTPAATAGLLKGDILLLIDEVEPQRRLREVFQYLAGKIDQEVKVRIKREGQEKSLNLKVGSQENTSFQLMELPEATTEQLKLRADWLPPISKTANLSGN